MKNIFTALLLGFTAILCGQNSLSGLVSDDHDAPMSNVSVYIPILQKGTVTDANGKYQFGNLPSGNLQITFSYIGYTIENRTLSVNGNLVLDIKLEENIHQMDEVIVSTAFKRLQSQNVMKVDHASVKSLQQQGASTLVEGIDLIPGVSQKSTGTSIGKPVIRGLSGNRVLVYSQGIRIENQQFGDEHGLGLNDSGIESVEVIKGPASLLYGSDAIGGVLYFNPEKFANANTTTFDFGQRVFSNTLGSNTTAGLKTSTENWKFAVRGNYATHSDYQIPDGSRVINTRFNETDFKTGIGYSNSTFQSVLRYNFNRLDLGIPEEGIGGTSESKTTQFPKQLVANHIVSLKNNFFIGKSTLDADIGYISNHRQEFEDSDTAILQMHLETLNYDLKFHFPKWGKMEAIAGIQGMYQTNKNSGEEYLIPDATTTDFGIFTTANYEWKSNVIQAGIRFDIRDIATESNGIEGEEGYFEAIDRRFESFNASLGYKTKFTEKLVMRLNFASGFRAPNLAELTSNGVHEGTNRYEIGDSNLETEQNFLADLNLEYKGSHFEFFVNGFYNHINNYIFTSPTGASIDENPVFAYIQDEAVLFGGEAAIHFHPHPVDWLHIESAFETVTGKYNGGYLPSIPANTWSNTIRATLKYQEWLSEGYAKLNVTSAFAQHNTDQFETASEAYTLVNIGIGGTIKIAGVAFDASLNANNLFDKTYIAHLSRLKTDNIPNIGRNLILGINFKV